MASKAYTAQEMRGMADELDDAIYTTASAMLRQAADAMEREKKRVKKYEYAEKCVTDGGWSIVYRHRTDLLAYAKEIQDSGTELVRREVGEWEEVKDA